MSDKLAVRAGIGALVLLFGVSTLAVGAKREDPDAAGELYGDLYVIERDGKGEPVLRDVTYDDPETGDPVTVPCQQPLGSDCTLLPLWGDCLGELVGPLFCEFDPELYDACGVHESAVDLTQEVSFGRGSVARAQDFVIDSAYAEFIKTINDAVEVRFDPAGRIQLGLPVETPEATETVWKTIDAPLENLGLYREVVTNGCLGPVTDELMGEEGVPILVTYVLDEGAIDLLCGEGTLNTDGCVGGPRESDLLCGYDFQDPEWWLNPLVPDEPEITQEDLMLATAFLGGATDKGDPLSLDEIINVNTYLGLNTYTFTKVKKNRVLEVTYFDFDGFVYEQSLAFPASASWELLEHSCAAAEPHDPPHSFLSNEAFPIFSGGADLDAVDLPLCRAGVAQSACDSASSPGCGGANWFAQAAEHARKTIWFIHNWEVPEIAY